MKESNAYGLVAGQLAPSPPRRDTQCDNLIQHINAVEDQARNLRDLCEEVVNSIVGGQAEALGQDKAPSAPGLYGAGHRGCSGIEAYLNEIRDLLQRL